jgi:hypothetical protein
VANIFNVSQMINTLLAITGAIFLFPIVWVGGRVAYFTYRYKSIVKRLPKDLPCYKSKEWPIAIIFDPQSGYERWMNETGVFDETGQPLPHFFAVRF